MRVMHIILMTVKMLKECYHFLKNVFNVLQNDRTAYNCEDRDEND